MQALPEIQIQRANTEDAAAIVRVLYESFAGYEAFYTREGFAATTLNAEQVLVRMKEGPVWTASRQAEVLGTVAAVIRQGSVYMRGMAVVPVARGLRVGARLVEEVERWAGAEACRRVFLSTTPFLGAAIRLYEGFGFRRIEEEPQDLFGTPLFTMEKKLF